MFSFTGSSRPHCFTFSNKIAEVGGEPGWARQVLRAVMKWRSSASVLFLRRCRLQTVCRAVRLCSRTIGKKENWNPADFTTHSAPADPLRALPVCSALARFPQTRHRDVERRETHPLDKHSATGVIKMSADAATLTDEYWCDVDAIYSLHPADALSQQLTEKNTDQLLRWGRKHGGDGAGGARLQEHVKKKNETSIFFFFVSHLFVLSFFLFSFFVRDLDPCPAPVWSYKTQNYVLSSPCCISNQLGLQSAGRTSLCGLWVKSCVWTLVNKRFIRGNEAETNRWELTQCSLCFLQKQQPRWEFVLSAAENTFIMFLAQTWFHPQVSTHQLLWVFSMQMLLIDGTSSFIKDEAVLRWASLRYYKHHLICISVCGRQSDEPSSFLISSRQILPEQKIKVCVWRRFFTL